MRQFIDMVCRPDGHPPATKKRRLGWCAAWLLTFFVVSLIPLMPPAHAFFSLAGGAESVAAAEDALQLAQYHRRGGRYGRFEGRRPGGGHRSGGHGRGGGISIDIGRVIIREAIRETERAREREWRRRRRDRPRVRDRRKKISIVCRGGRVRRGRCICGRGRVQVRHRQFGFVCERRGRPNADVVIDTPRRCSRRGYTRRRCSCPGTLRRDYVRGRGYRCVRKPGRVIVEEAVRPPPSKRSLRVTKEKPRVVRDKPRRKVGVPRRPSKTARTALPRRWPVIPPIGASDTVPEYVADEVVVALRRTAPSALVQRLAQRHGLTVLETLESDLINRRIVRFGMKRSGDVPAMANRLRQDPNVLGAQPNHIFRKPNDQVSALGPDLRNEIRNNQLRRNRQPARSSNSAEGNSSASPNQAAPSAGQQAAGVNGSTAGGSGPGNTRAVLASGPQSGSSPDESEWREGQTSDMQYALVKVGVRKAHTETGGGDGKGIVIAVIDSGVDGQHVDLKGAVRKSYNALGDRDPKPDDHGTAVAGIIGGRGLVRGVAPGAGLLDVRAFKAGVKNGPLLATAFVLQRGMAWAMKNQARVLNLSFAGPHDELLHEAVKAINRRRAIMVAAAGNGGADAAPAYPAAYKEVIAVTATDPADKLYEKANRGAYIALAAPGVEILAPITGNAHNMHSGTSFAAPHISGILALMLEREPTLSAQEALDVLISGARDLGPPGRDELFGAGEANAYRALQQLKLTPAQRQ